MPELLFEAILPCVPGFVEDVVDGKHCLVPVPDANALQFQGLTQENKLLKAQVQTLSGRGDFLEECLVEIAGQVY